MEKRPRTDESASVDAGLPDEDVPVTEPTVQPRLPAHSQPLASPSLSVSTMWTKIKLLWLPLSQLILSMVFLSILGWIFHDMMLAEDPSPGLLLSATTANILLSILTQLFGMQIHLLYSELFNFLRWQLASRPRGVSASIFFALSSATGPVATFVFTIADKCKSWGVLRMLFPVLVIFFGTMLKVNATFPYYFHRTGNEVSIFAGLTPVNFRDVLTVTPARYICLYYSSWMPVLLSVTKFGISKPHPTCGDGCNSIFLPGGLESARMVRPSLNSSLLKGAGISDAEAVRIKDAPGYHLKYEKLNSSFSFDWEADCRIYGQAYNDAIQMCIRNVDQSIAVGWVACPHSLYERVQCYNDTTWMTTRMTEKVLLTSYKQRATTVYHGKNFTILDSQFTGPSSIEPLQASAYRAIWDKIFVANNDSSANDRTLIASLTWSLGWLMRLYDDDYPDDHNTPLIHLQNFLAIPIQFTTACIIYANSTQNLPADSYPLPDDMTTNAQTGVVIQRLLGWTWALVIFLAVGGILIVLALGILGWMIRCKALLLPPSDTPEVDMAQRSRASPDGEMLHGSDELIERVKSKKLMKAKSPWKLAWSIRNIRLFWMNGDSSFVDKEAGHAVRSAVHQPLSEPLDGEQLDNKVEDTDSEA